MKPSQRIREIARARLVAVCKRNKTAPVDEDWIDFALEMHGPSSVDVMAYLDEQHAAGLALDRVVDEVRSDTRPIMVTSQAQADELFGQGFIRIEDEPVKVYAVPVKEDSER